MNERSPSWRSLAPGLASSRLGAALALLAMLLAAGAYVAVVTRMTEAAVRQSLAAHQARSVETFESWFDDSVKHVRRWADRTDTRDLVRTLLALDSPSTEDLNKHSAQTAFRASFAAVQGREGVLGYFVIAPDGRSLGSLSAANTGTQNLLTREPEFIEQMRQRGGALSPLMRSDVPLLNSGAVLDGRNLTLFVGVPVYLGGPEPAAYFTMRMPPAGLLAVQGRTRLGEGGVSYLTDTFGRLHADRVWLNVDLARAGLSSEPFRGNAYLFARDPGRNVFTLPAAEARPETPDRSMQPLTVSADAARLRDGMQLVPYRDHRGVSVVGSWTRSPRLGLAVVTELPADEAFAPIARAKQHVLMAGAVLAFSLMAWFAWRLDRSRRLLQVALVNAEAAGRAKGVFLANMSHEIRTPLNAVLGVTHLMGNTTLTPMQRDYLRMISSSGQALLGTLNDILDYSKVEAGKLELLNAEFKLNDIVDTLSAIMGVSAASKDLDLVIGIESDVPGQLVGDAQRLLQVLVNLAGNAIKFTPAGQVVLHISTVTSAEPLRLRFSVRDTGIGIAPAKLAQLFEPFTQADVGITRDFGGTGLGLAICHRLVALMQGEIGVVSELGEGSEFWFTVPLAAGSLPAVAASAQTSNSLDVMVVDDNEIAREFLTKMVERLGWVSKEAASGRDAVDTLNRGRTSGGDICDVILVDGTMAHMDGMQTSRAIRAIDRLKQPPIVVIVTALGREQVMASKDSADVDAVIAKPVTPSKLLDAVMQARLRRTPGLMQSVVRAHAPARVVNDLLGLRLLLVEDNYINQQVARGILEAEGAIVTSADNGMQALDLLRETPSAFDLVLMDVQMPVLDGLSATRRLRQELKLDVPVIAMSAGVMQSERDVCLQAGMNDFIAKPLDSRALVQTLRALWLAARGQAGSPPVPPMPPAMSAPAPVPVVLPRIDGIDVPVLFDAVNGQRDAMERLLRRLVIECEHIVPALRDACRADDHPAARHLLHAFKGAAANMRAGALAAHAAALEDAGRTGGTAAIALRLPAFVEQVQALHRAVLDALAADASAP